MCKPFQTNIAVESYDKLDDMKSTRVASEKAKYLIRITDDSLSPKIEQGSLISIVQKDTYYSEDMVLASIDGETNVFCCLWIAPKEVFPDTVVLLPLNRNKYKAKVVTSASKHLFIMGAADMMVRAF